MVEKKVVDYLLEGKKRGFSVQLLSHKLVENGWDEATVKDAIEFIEKQSLPSEKKTIPSVDLRINNQVAQKTNPTVEKGVQTSEVIKKEIKPAPTINSSEDLPERIHLQQEGMPGTFRKIGMVIVHPGQLFEKTQNEKAWNGLKHIWIVSLVPFILLLAAVMFLFKIVVSMIGKLGVPQNILVFGVSIADLSTLTFKVLGVFTAGIIILVFLAVPLIFLIAAGILHLFAKMFKGQGGYAQSFNAVAYGMTPTILLFFIPGISIWSFVLEIMGIARYHKLSKFKAFLVLLGAALLCFIIAVAIMLVLGIKLPLSSV